MTRPLALGRRRYAAAILSSDGHGIPEERRSIVPGFDRPRGDVPAADLCVGRQGAAGGAGAAGADRAGGGSPLGRRLLRPHRGRPALPATWARAPPPPLPRPAAEAGPRGRAWA